MKKESIIIIDDPYIKYTKEQKKNVLLWYDKVLKYVENEISMSFFISKRIRGKEVR